MVNIAVLGYGTVGSGVVEVIDTNGAGINQRIGDETSGEVCPGSERFSGRSGAGEDCP